MEDVGAGGGNRLANAADLVGSEGVHHNDIPFDSDGARNWATLT